MALPSRSPTSPRRESAAQRQQSQLDAEVSDSFTVGAVFTPEFAPGSVVVGRYYSIKLENVIFSLAGQTIITSAMTHQAVSNNQFCAAVFRRPMVTFQGQQTATLVA
jgi:hypothetical protein